MCRSARAQGSAPRSFPLFPLSELSSRTRSAGITEATLLTRFARRPKGRSDVRDSGRLIDEERHWFDDRHRCVVTKNDGRHSGLP